MHALILASASPRRRELLTGMGIPFTIHPSDADETVAGTPEEMVRTLALRKASQVAQACGEGWIVGADTLVALDGQALGKPADCLGIGHTRWATHGEPNDVNAHPHLSQHGDVALVHNGIVENYIELRDFLTEQGYSFMSETDTEIAANLVEHLYRSNREDGPEAAIREALSLISGAFALGIIFADHPDTLYAVRKDSPLIVGVGKGENFIASAITNRSFSSRTVRISLLLPLMDRPSQGSMALNTGTSTCTVCSSVTNGAWVGCGVDVTSVFGAIRLRSTAAFYS